VQFPAYSVATDSNGNDTEYTIGGPDDANNFWPGYVTTGVGSYSGCSPHHSGCSPAGTLLKSETYVLTATVSSVGGGASPSSPAFIPQLFTIPPTKVTQTTIHLPGTGGIQLSKVVSALVPAYSTCSVAAYPAYNSSSEPLQYYSDTSCYSTAQVQSTATYDFGTPGSSSSGPLLKTEYTTYVWQPSLPQGFPSQLSVNSSNSAYLSAGLIDLVNQELTQNGSGGWAAQTNFSYDQSPSPSGAKGNLTAISRFVSSGSSVQTQKQYNANGVVTLSIDANGNQTQYGPSFACNGALPQTVTQAYGSKTINPETTTYAYDCNTGKVTSLTDPNTQITSFTYDDPFSRVTSANYPDGGQIQKVYNDAVPSPTITTCQLINGTSTATCSATSPATGWKTTLDTMDGIFRLVQTELASDPSGPTFTATSYDDMGRTYQVWNPTRCSTPTSNCGTETTFGYTTTTYDALNRVTSVIEQDGSTVSTSYGSTPPSGYSGYCTTVTDEAGNSRESCVDGLGRMTIIVEDPGVSPPHLNYLTTYTYNALNDLLSVTQKGSNSSNARVRTFVYDGLSRLTSATNPESGQIQYGYDPNGNVITRTAPSPNQPSTGTATVTTSYTYDALNRLTGKSYSDSYSQNPATPAVTYAYDANNISSCPVPIGFYGTGGGAPANPIGRRTAMCYGVGSKSWSYDSMGRVSTESDVTRSCPTTGRVLARRDVPMIGFGDCRLPVAWIDGSGQQST
jgi:YD repeat-containing protein